MHVSLVGASGTCGRQVALQLIEHQILTSEDQLDLVGVNPRSLHPSFLIGWREDLADAFCDTAPQINIVSHLEEVQGDLIIILAGTAAGTHPKAMTPDARAALATANLPLFQGFRRSIRYQSSSPSTLLMVTNPVELGVCLFAQEWPRERVIGLGAHLDSLRFRREIANQEKVARQEVSGYILGEHGGHMLPMWSTVKVGDQARNPPHPIAAFPERLGLELRKIQGILQSGNLDAPAEALRYAKTLSPDLRAALVPMATHFSGAKTAVATGRAVADIVSLIKQGKPREIAVQYLHHGEGGIYGPVGNRVRLSDRVEEVLPITDLTEDEQNALRNCAHGVQSRIESWLASTAP